MGRYRSVSDLGKSIISRLPNDSRYLLHRHLQYRIIVIGVRIKETA